jgi:hypothetical protein
LSIGNGQSTMLLTGDFPHNFVELARPFANVFDGDALVVAVHAFVVLGGRSTRRAIR